MSRASRRSRPLALLLVAACAPPAHAHVGNIPAKAAFYLPPPPLLLPAGDGGMRWSWQVAEADAHYLFAWQDGDNDPTGRFTFRYVDHVIPTAAAADFVDGKTLDGKPTGAPPLGQIVRDTMGRLAEGIWVGCACEGQDAAGVLLDGGNMPQCFDGGARWCDNAVDWDTSAVPDGVYWLYAVNTDPPFHIYNVSEAPIRVRHGQKRAPAAIVVRPGPAGSSGDASYRGNLLLDGEGVLGLDLRYGDNDPDRWQQPLRPITSGLATVKLADGSFGFDWDTSAVPDGTYFIDVTVTDGMGGSSRSGSRHGMTVAHRPDMARPGSMDLAAPADLHANAGGDLSAAVDGPGGGGGGGCGCHLGARRGASPTPTSTSASALAACLSLAALLRATRRRRG